MKKQIYTLMGVFLTLLIQVSSQAFDFDMPETFPSLLCQNENYRSHTLEIKVELNSQTDFKPLFTAHLSQKEGVFEISCDFIEKSQRLVCENKDNQCQETIEYACTHVEATNT